MTKAEFIMEAEKYNGTVEIIKVVALFRCLPEELSHLMKMIKRQKKMKKKHLKEYR